ncbi:MAG: signal transduction histidine kinase [Planctomycetota bacterium]|jgi:signal transduction histidine kinase
MDLSLLTLLEKTRRIGTWTVDVRAAICTWSRATYAIHEEDPSKVIRLEDGINYYVPEHRPIIEKCVQDSIEQRMHWDVELQIRTAAGRLRWVRAIGESVFDGATLIRLQGAFEDIDARKRLEVERESLLRRILEGERLASLGHWWWSAATDSVEWTRGTYRIHEVPEDQAPPGLEDYLRKIHPEDRVRVQLTRQRAIDSESSYSVEFRLVCDGREKCVRSEGFPQHDGEGRLTGYTGVAIERTDQVEAQLQIEELNLRLVLALEASRIGVWDWNIETNELIWDPHMYQLYGVTEGECSGAYEAWAQGLHPDDELMVVEKVERAVAERSKVDGTFRVIWPDGSVRTLQVKADVVLNSKGEPFRMIGANWDITDFTRIQQELERSNEELAQFAYRTSHDLKSPLTGIRRLAAYMEQDLAEGAFEDLAHNVSAIGKRVGAMESMVSGILDTARADLTSAQPEPIDMEAIMVEIAESHQVLSEDNDVEVSWSIDCPEKPTLTRMRVYQILANLISNGIKYSAQARDERFVRLNIASLDGRVVLTVEDNGTGMKSEHADMPYEMFARLHSGVSGSGLGLYIVKKHVEALSGRIHLESSEAGTRFEINLPLHQPSPSIVSP